MHKALYPDVSSLGRDTYTYIHTYIHRYIHTYIHPYMHACTHTHTFTQADIPPCGHPSMPTFIDVHWHVLTCFDIL